MQLKGGKNDWITEAITESAGPKWGIYFFLETRRGTGEEKGGRKKSNWKRECAYWTSVSDRAQVYVCLYNSYIVTSIHQQGYLSINLSTYLCSRPVVFARSDRYYAIYYVLYIIYSFNLQLTLLYSRSEVTVMKRTRSLEEQQLHAMQHHREEVRRHSLWATATLSNSIIRCWSDFS